ncbi:mitochondrial Complex III (CIII) ubiquinol:cytochrome c oxidoreductase Qcr9 [Andalucia godoyi]|uniref:Complex III subunit 9 n=1 Tax=Andalucia godoyi TaxID=505711 RepID=A0A8K0AIK5_ANDGO|nr:mitochondrial Complex III (CIII) ubiquinol:cytochrome c oxidoreductase Qcr9 [Andalucia godoyi]|eukprot:ANDGO_04983.mRNA.1 mitochondrial Complex III (CIII) ubiquinol:cytochrome c oxidoreductase Qcr9
MSKQLFGSALGGAVYRAVFQSNPVYIAFCLTGAFVGEQIYDKAVNAMWQSGNKGKFFEDIKIAPKDEE